MGPLMIIRTNLQSEDIRIEATDPLEARLERLFSELRDPSSPHYIQSDYLFYRCRLIPNIPVQHSFCRYLMFYHL